jgi:hypothetical protein
MRPHRGSRVQRIGPTRRQSSGSPRPPPGDRGRYPHSAAGSRDCGADSRPEHRSVPHPRAVWDKRAPWAAMRPTPALQEATVGKSGDRRPASVIVAEIPTAPPDRTSVGQRAALDAGPSHTQKQCGTNGRPGRRCVPHLRSRGRLWGNPATGVAAQELQAISSLRSTVAWWDLRTPSGPESFCGGSRGSSVQGWLQVLQPGCRRWHWARSGASRGGRSVTDSRWRAGGGCVSGRVAGCRSRDFAGSAD